SAMTYPGIITVFSLLVIVFILLFVVPSFTEIYNDMDAQITGITKAVLFVSDFLKANYLVLLLLIVGVIIGIIVLYNTVKAFRTTLQIFLMHIPVIKNLIIYNELTIFAKTFASLLRNNVFITDSMDILSKITNNEIYRAILYKTINNIVKGEKISEAFKDHWAVPDVAYYMIVTGESTGDLATMMQKVSEYYQEMHKSIVNNLKSFIEPIMISGLALIVGLIIIAVIVPMFSIYEQIN
ncbi:MAG: type II secretion system F family protein, partial [Bacilli bacterium]